jgi:hypothetical protein
MPRRKISLEEAYAVFEQHGLQVEISGIQKLEEPAIPQQSLFAQPYGVPEKAERKVGKHTVRIVLHTQQTITSGGEAVYEGSKLIRIDGQSAVTYGPGIVYVPTEIAGDLLHQDQLARRADADFLSTTFKSYVITGTSDGRHVAKLASVDQNFDMSGFLGMLGNTPNAIQLPF